MFETVIGVEASLIDVLDRVLDKGIVIDAWAQLALMGIHVVTFDGRFVVASIETYVQRREEVATTPAVAPRLGRASESAGTTRGGRREKRPNRKTSEVGKFTVFDKEFLKGLKIKRNQRKAVSGDRDMKS